MSSPAEPQRIGLRLGPEITGIISEANAADLTGRTLMFTSGGESIAARVEGVLISDHGLEVMLVIDDPSLEMTRVIRVDQPRYQNDPDQV